MNMKLLVVVTPLSIYQVLPWPHHASLRLHSRQMEDHPVVESAKGLTDPGIHHQGNRFKEEVCMNNRLVECYRGLGVCPLLPQNTGEPCTFTTCLLNIGIHGWTVFVRCGEELTKKVKLGHHLQSPGRLLL